MICDPDEAVIFASEPKRTVIVCWQVLVLPQASAASQVRVATSVLVSVRFVTVLITWRVTALHVSEARGSSKVQASGAETVRSGLQVNAGGVVSRTVIFWTQLLELPHWSVAVQVRAMTLIPLQLLLTASLWVTMT